MRKKSSGIWSFLLPLSVIVLAVAYYIKMPAVRKEVDARAPWVKDILGRYVKEPEVRTIIVKQEAPATPAPAKAAEAPKPEVAPVKAPKIEEKVAVAPPAPEPTTLDLRKIANDRSSWPTKVVLTKPASFPAVLNGKIVGSLVAPAGSEATLVSIKDDKVGLEFNGGGAWVPADQTDLLARVQSVH